MKQSDDNRFIPLTSVASHKGHEVRPDIYYYTNQIVNVVFVGMPDGDWVMIDAGMPKSANELLRATEKRFGKGSKPKAIILTHGHFDHVGSVTGLLREWDCQVYAHPLEFPFLTGRQDYPEPDTSVQGGLAAKLSAIYPHESIDISGRLKPLPEDLTVPHLPGWRWIHTPGHTPGHISLFRDGDRTLISGDAFVTVRADSLYRVVLQVAEVNGPPRYLTTNWESAKASVQLLNNLAPELAITGHGKMMQGKELTDGLKKLVDNFDEMAIPSHGKFVNR